MRTNLFLYLFCSIFLLTLSDCKHPTSYEHLISVEDHFSELSTLPSEVDESSGLDIWNGSLWTHNDSGDDPKLYKIDPNTGKLLGQFYVEGAGHRDWEGMTRDDQYFYIGDFGNNIGTRQDLVIYKLRLDQIDEAKDTIPLHDKIFFSYDDQTRFDYEFNKHNYDCESLIHIGDQLYLFSKNHEDKQSRLYSLTKEEGTHRTKMLDQFDVDGTITDADYSEAEKLLVLLGYKYSDWTGFKPFVWLFSGFEGDQFFSGKSQKISLPVKVQTEGVVFNNGKTILISSEAEDGGTGQLYQLKLDEWLK